MAIKYKDIKETIVSRPFSNREISIIEKIENFIDDEIKTNFDNEPLRFNVSIIEFRYDPIQKTSYAFQDIKTIRKSLMSKELKRRYEAAGWVWEYESGEDDGPNRPAIDYWLLKGK